MDPLYKVGDEVLIKSAYDPGCTALNYRFNFLKDMLYRFGGKVCTISKVEKQRERWPNGVSDDNYLYLLKEDNEAFYWASSMFEPEF